MKQLADDVWMLSGFPPAAINAYILGNVLVDAGTRYARRRILRQLRGRAVSAHALTHAHPDHQGSSKVVCEHLGLPLWCGVDDVYAMETAGAIRAAAPKHFLTRMIDAVWTGPPCAVARHLREGDEVAGFTVLDTPGHTAGHVSFWREADRVLVCGDVLNGMNLLTAIPGLREPPTILTADPARNRASIRKLAALEPELLCFGHGPPIRGGAKRLGALAENLPAQ